MFIGRKILIEYEYRKQIGYKYTKHDVKWSISILFTYPIYAFISGTLSGMLGIGGGLIVGPLLLDLGLHPVVSTATSNFLVLFTASSTSIQFMFMVYIINKYNSYYWIGYDEL